MTTTRKRKRILDEDDFSINSISSDEEVTGYNAADFDAVFNEGIATTRAKRQKKNSIICSTNDEIIKATLENQQFSISPTLTSLVIKDVGLEGMHAGRNLGLALSESTNITQIDIHNCSLDVVRVILKSVKTKKKLTELVIKSDKQNENDNGELRELAALLPKLQTLWIENYVLSLDSIKHIFGKVINGAPLKKLGIINAKLMQGECAVIAEGFGGNKGGVVKMAQLNLSHNPLITTQAVATLVDRLHPEEVDLTNCQITDDGLKYLANGLHHRQIIKDLKLGRNHIGQRGLKLLIKKVNNNFSLISLDLRGIHFPHNCFLILNKKLKSKTLKSFHLDIEVPLVTDVITKNTLLEGFNFGALLQAINENKWDAVWEIIKQKPNVPLRYMIPLDKVPIAKAHKVHTLAIETLKKNLSDLTEKHREEVVKKENEKERVDYLNKRKLELENELKQVIAELNDITNIQAREEAMKARTKDIEATKNSLQQTERSMQNIERDIQAWKELVKRDVMTWSKDEVQMVVRNIGLCTYEGILNQNKVTGSVLAHLTTTDFHQLGFSHPHTMRVVKAMFLAKHFKSTEAPPGVLQWTVQDVKDWLTKNKFQNLTGTFANNQITGSELLFLQTPDLKDWLRVDTLADRVRLEQAIAVLKNSVIEENHQQPQVKQQPAVKEKPKVPSHFKCPITTEIMKDPVIASDGHTYERFAIEQWLLNHNTSPMTNEELANKQLHPCHYLKNMIAEFLEQNKTEPNIQFKFVADNLVKISLASNNLRVYVEYWEIVRPDSFFGLYLLEKTLQLLSEMTEDKLQTNKMVHHLCYLMATAVIQPGNNDDSKFIIIIKDNLQMIKPLADLYQANEGDFDEEKNAAQHLERLKKRPFHKASLFEFLAYNLRMLRYLRREIDKKDKYEEELNRLVEKLSTVLKKMPGEIVLLRAPLLLQKGKLKEAFDEFLSGVEPNFVISSMSASSSTSYQAFLGAYHVAKDYLKSPELLEQLSPENCKVISEHYEKLQSCFDQGLCTRATGNRTFYKQYWYGCYTCGYMGMGNGLCYSCTKTCHAGHEVDYVEIADCYCDDTNCKFEDEPEEEHLDHNDNQDGPEEHPDNNNANENEPQEQPQVNAEADAN